MDGIVHGNGGAGAGRGGRGRRIEGLDAMRGLAALVVFVSHCVLVLAVWPRWLVYVLWSPVSPFLLGGHEAVLFFFLLSGFVLFLPYGRDGGGRAYWPYLVKRVCRIYLPYLAGVAFVAAGYWLTFRARALPGISVYFSWGPMSGAEFWRLLWEHVLFLGSFHRERWNSSTWTLAEEMRISIFFPAIAASVLRVGWRWVLAGAAACSVLVAVGVAAVGHQFPLMTLHYAAVFAVGAVMAREREELVAWWRRLGRVRQSALVVCSVLALAYLPPVARELPRWIREQATDWAVLAPLAVLLVGALAETWFTRVLEGQHLQRLGRVSYSFYLLHVPCLYMAIELLWGRLPAVGVFAVALLATMGLAEVFFRWVELPSIAVGRRWAERVRGGELARATGERASG